MLKIACVSMETAVITLVPISSLHTYTLHAIKNDLTCNTLLIYILIITIFLTFYITTLYALQTLDIVSNETARTLRPRIILQNNSSRTTTQYGHQLELSATADQSQRTAEHVQRLRLVQEALDEYLRVHQVQLPEHLQPRPIGNHHRFAGLHRLPRSLSMPEF